ncbi:MAG: hypothetical protein ACNA8W_00895 [Bradymonadaceae bacterium]
MSTTPGRKLLHPLPLAAALLIACNDFYLKIHHAGWWSGKLSDFGLMIFLPIWLYALMEWAYWLALRRSPPARLFASVSCGVAGGYFAALQLWEPWARFHVAALEMIVPSMSFVVTPDVTDLIALLMLPVAWVYLRGVAPHQSAEKRSTA